LKRFPRVRGREVLKERWRGKAESTLVRLKLQKELNGRGKEKNRLGMGATSRGRKTKGGGKGSAIRSEEELGGKKSFGMPKKLRQGRFERKSITEGASLRETQRNRKREKG